MPFTRLRADLLLSEEDRLELERISTSRTESYARVTRAKIMLRYADGKSNSSIARELGISRPTIDTCIKKALAGGIELALKELQRSGRPSTISDDAKTWIINIACKKPKEFDYAQETWTYRLLAKHVRKNASKARYPSLKKAGKSLIFKILNKAEIKPHKISYYLEKRDPDFEEKMAQVLYFYKKIQIVNENEAKNRKSRSWVAISYDEKPGIQALDFTAPDLSPVPGKYPTISRDYEYKRLGTVSLLAGIDLHTGKVHGLVRDRHRSREFIEFLEKLNNEYPAKWKLKIILDNHSAHISKETVGWLNQYPGRFEFVFTPKHGSWLNLIEVFFSKMSRTFLRLIRVKSKEELKKRILKYLDEVNEEPVVFRWKYKMDETKV